MLFWFVVVLCVLVAVQIVRAERLFWKIGRVLDHAERLLSMTETHARITDSRGARIEEAAQEAKVTARAVKEEVKAAVEDVPQKVVQKLQEVQGDSLDSGAKLPVVKLPPHKP